MHASYEFRRLMSYVSNLVTVLSYGIVCDEFRQVINNAVLSYGTFRIFDSWSVTSAAWVPSWVVSFATVVRYATRFGQAMSAIESGSVFRNRSMA